MGLFFFRKFIKSYSIIARPLTDLLKNNVKREIEKAQATNKRNFDKTRKPAVAYKVGELVAVKRTQFVAGRKLANEYLGPYEVTGIKRNDRYNVRKAANYEGPNITTTSADHMKLWSYITSNEELELSDEEIELD